MFLHQFYSNQQNGIVIDARQASVFAKEIAGDFNPLHDPDAKRFCVPGDLLFALALEKYGLYRQMKFTFAGMVGHGVNLQYPKTDAEQFDICDDKGKTYLRIQRSGDVSRDDNLIEDFIYSYVSFSGHNFPDVLVPLMAEHDVMINIARPLVIYESMSLELKHLDFKQPTLELSDTSFEANGKRGEARLFFEVFDQGICVGNGFKKLLISGMRAYEHDVIQAFSENFTAHKLAYKA